MTRCGRFFALVSRNNELITSSGVKNHSSTAADHFAGHPHVEVPVPQSRVNLGDDPAERAIASATA
jgi:hypothetical protein